LSDKLERVKECPNCGWLFLDTTKNGKRRWCSMEDCGSNVKALEYYYRKKKEKK
jgi:predicted RNA-binding Zn ribbon-like protein